MSPRIELSVGLLLYILVGMLAVITRFWGLSDRAMNHDESLHTYYSWLLATDFRYIHDPMMHGPGLFHSNALVYFLFGDNDYTSRVVPAFLGVLIVLLPALVRQPALLGRWGALACSTLLLFSPSIMFYTRFIRHDPYVLFATLLIVFSMLRYMLDRERKWIITVWITTGFLFTTLEVSFIIAFILVTFVGLIMAWQIDRTLLGVAGFALVAMGAVWVGMPRLGAPALPGIPWEDPSSENIRTFATDLATHPTILMLLGIVVLALVAMIVMLRRVRPEGMGWLDGVLGSTPPATTTRVIYDGLKDRRGMLIGIAGGLLLYVVLYTTFFTNMDGLASGTVGSLGYWLGQQDVQRGAQPWFYYLVLVPQYEFIAVLLFPIGAVLTLWRIVPRIISGRPISQRTYLRGLCLYWAVMMIAILSWAGEKMPWLSVHIALPLILLAGSYIGGALEWIEARLATGRMPALPAVTAAVGTLAIGGGWFLFWTWATAGPEGVVGRGRLVQGMRPEIADQPWLLYLPLVGLAALVVTLSVRYGWRPVLTTSGLTLLAALLIVQIHAGYRFNYLEGDEPRDMLNYSQASPDVPMVMEDLGLLSRELTGDYGLRIAWDQGVSWPHQWYLRDYPNRRFYRNDVSNVLNSDVILIATDNLVVRDDDGNVVTNNEAMLTGYTPQQYTMRWFFPEINYRAFAIAPELNDEGRQNYQTDEEGPFSALDVVESVWRSVSSLREPDQQAKIFRLVAFRELPEAVMGGYDYRVYVRNDLVSTYDAIRYR